MEFFPIFLNRLNFLGCHITSILIGPVLHVGDEWQEFFYPALRPWLHYVPVDKAATEDDLQDLLEFIRQHDEEMREIAERGAAFIRQHLKFADIGCYWRKLLTSYAALLKYTVERDPTLIEIRGKWARGLTTRLL